MIANKTNCVPKEYGGGHKVCCPKHDDRNPSLSIREVESGKILMHCFGGCKTEDICLSIGITMCDLFPRKNRW